MSHCRIRVNATILALSVHPHPPTAVRLYHDEESFLAALYGRHLSLVRFDVTLTSLRAAEEIDDHAQPMDAESLQKELASTYSRNAPSCVMAMHWAMEDVYIDQSSAFVFKAGLVNSN